jgi:hypothetical protein
MLKHPEPAFPPVLNINGRNYVWRSDFEKYKVELIRYATGGRSGPPAPPRPDQGDILVPFKIVSEELGVGRRTIGRRMKVQNADPDAPAAVHGASMSP